MRVLVLSDTHAPRIWKGLPEGLVAPLQQADLVLHAGDVCIPSVLDDLAVFAPVRVVLGNNDEPAVAAWGAPHSMEFELEGLAVAMVHDAGPAAGRDRRMHRRFPTAQLVVFGHSHIPMDAPDGAVHLFNPGSPTDKRRQPRPSYGVLEVSGGRLVSSRIITL